MELTRSLQVQVEGFQGTWQSYHDWDEGDLTSVALCNALDVQEVLPKPT